MKWHDIPILYENDIDSWSHTDIFKLLAQAAPGYPRFFFHWVCDACGKENTVRWTPDMEQRPEPLAYRPCGCPCHKDPTIKHVRACCEGGITRTVPQSWFERFHGGTP